MKETYKPTPGEMKKAKGMMSKKEKSMSDLRSDNFEPPRDIRKWTPEQLEKHGAGYILMRGTEEEIRNLKKKEVTEKATELSSPEFGMDSDWIRVTITYEGRIAGVDIKISKIDEYNHTSHWTSGSERYNESIEPYLEINDGHRTSVGVDELYRKVVSILG